MLRWLVWILGSCGPAEVPDEPDPTPDPVDDTDVVVLETDSVPPVADTEAQDTFVPEPLVMPTDWGAGFVDLSAPLWNEHAFQMLPGIPGQTPPQVVRAWFGDLDGEGPLEVVIGHGLRGTPVDGVRAVRVFHVQGDQLVRDETLEAALDVARTPPLGALDLDGDGLSDLLGGNVRAAVRWGEAPGRWGPWTTAEGADASFRPGDALTLFDLDQDGWLDLMLGDFDCVHGLVPALATGLRTFRVDLDVIEDRPQRLDAFATATLQDGSSVVFTVAGNCGDDLHPGFLRWTWTEDGWPRLASYAAVPPDAWWTNLPQSPGGVLTNLAPMGAGFTDLDGDGTLDLLVTTGITYQAVAAGDGQGAFDPTGLIDAIVRPESPVGVPEYGWSVDFPDLDQDGRADVVMTLGDDGTSFMALGGYPLANAVYWNAGDFGFVDVSEAVGLVQEGSWHALGLADLDEDGDADLVIGGYGNLGRVYRNEIDTGRRGLSLSLRGTTSNRFGIGARLEVTVRGLPTRTLQMGGLGNFDGLSPPLVFLGTGRARAADRVRITWPSGLVQDVVGLQAGTTHEIVEPPLVTVVEPGRHLPADGQRRRLLVVTPRDATGALRSVSAVQVRTLGAAVALEPAVRLGDTWEVWGTVPEVAGSTAFEVTLDGVAVGIRPRLWWDPVP